MNEREMLLKRIQICDFALFDTALFLDINPDDEMALAFYQKHAALRADAAKEYVSKYGPITHMDHDDGGDWKWVDGPWPWQNIKEAL